MSQSEETRRAVFLGVVWSTSPNEVSAVVLPVFASVGRPTPVGSKNGLTEDPGMYPLIGSNANSVGNVLRVTWPLSLFA